MRSPALPRLLPGRRRDRPGRAGSSSATASAARGLIRIPTLGQRGRGGPAPRAGVAASSWPRSRPAAAGSAERRPSTRARREPRRARTWRASHAMLQRVALDGLDGAACELGYSREALALSRSHPRPRVPGTSGWRPRDDRAGAVPEPAWSARSTPPRTVARSTARTAVVLRETSRRLPGLDQVDLRRSGRAGHPRRGGRGPGPRARPAAGAPRRRQRRRRAPDPRRAATVTRRDRPAGHRVHACPGTDVALVCTTEKLDRARPWTSPGGVAVARKRPVDALAVDAGDRHGPAPPKPAAAAGVSSDRGRHRPCLSIRRKADRLERRDVLSWRSGTGTASPVPVHRVPRHGRVGTTSLTRSTLDRIALARIALPVRAA